jgi:hypothetical protein
MIPQKIVLKLASKGIADFSAKVGHATELHFLGTEPNSTSEASAPAPPTRHPSRRIRWALLTHLPSH